VARVTLWSLETDSEHAGPVISSPGPTVSSTGFSPDGSTLAIGLSNGSIEVWDLPALKHRATVGCHKLGVRSVGLQLSHDGRTLAAWGRFSGADSLLGAILQSVGRLTNPASAAARQEVVVVDIVTGERLGVVSSAVHPFLSPDGRTLAVRDSSLAIELFDLPATGTVGPPREEAPRSLGVGH
jgi:WD40 repeat protein